MLSAYFFVTCPLITCLIGALIASPEVVGPFCINESSQDQVSHLCWLLMWFEILLRLKINLENNKLIQIWSIPNIELLAGELGCKVGCLPSTYFWIVFGFTS